MLDRSPAEETTRGQSLRGEDLLSQILQCKGSGASRSLETPGKRLKSQRVH